ncbi:hypothetical protein M8818_006733 [Zalaria obscura]|uniref:Uncharacterized protein n=1 Tax=Zalaria obscura TaxID=2024903 RepID=A0ACC3S4S2_9PEZI
MNAEVRKPEEGLTSTLQVGMQDEAWTPVLRCLGRHAKKYTLAIGCSMKLQLPSASPHRFYRYNFNCHLYSGAGSLYIIPYRSIRLSTQLSAENIVFKISANSHTTYLTASVTPTSSPPKGVSTHTSLPTPTMRYAYLPTTLLWTLLTLTFASLTTASIFFPFQSLFDTQPTNQTSPNLSTPIPELFKRQYNPTSCPSGYANNCGGLGNSALCCYSTATCTTDQGGNLACCRSGAACTGYVSQTVTGDETGAGAAAATTTTSKGLLGSSTTAAGVVTSTVTGGATATDTSTDTTGGFIIAGTSTVQTLGSGSGGVRRAEMVSSNPVRDAEGGDADGL